MISSRTRARMLLGQQPRTERDRCEVGGTRTAMYSRAEVDSAGIDLLEIDANPGIDDVDPERVRHVLASVRQWRELHAEPLQRLRETVEQSSRAAIQSALVVHRIKRMRSMLQKLETSSMRLTQMQDIGGCRVIVDSLADVRCVVDALTSLRNEEFQVVRRTSYTENPREATGYRSEHLVYRVRCDDSGVETVRLEVQVRSRLQHAWATAVEVASLVADEDLKSGSGDGRWVSLFRAIGELFARQEGAPALRELGSSQHLCGEVRRQLGDLVRLLDASLAVSIHPVAKHVAYQLVSIDRESRSLSIQTFNAGQSIAAIFAYGRAEEDARKSHGRLHVALVSARDAEELRDAYGNYFYETAEFRMAVNDVMLAG